MTTRRRRQTRTRLTTGLDPWLHNREVAFWKSMRLADRAVINARRVRRRPWTSAALAAFHAPIGAAVAREIEREQQWQRRARVTDCLFCTYADSMTQMHDPSPRCESGGYVHCTCDTCY